MTLGALDEGRNCFVTSVSGFVYPVPVSLDLALIAGVACDGGHTAPAIASRDTGGGSPSLMEWQRRYPTTARKRERL